MLPVITTSSMTFSFLLGANVLVENVFAWPGIGRALFEAILQREPREEEDATLAIITSVIPEQKFNEALAEMQRLPFVRAGLSRFRVEHFND